MVLGFILYEAVDLLWNFGGMTYRGSKLVYNWYYDIPTPDDIEISQLKKLNDIDWRRSSETWQGRTIENGRLRNSTRNISLTSNVLKQHLGLDLTNEEKKVETSFLTEKK